MKRILVLSFLLLNIIATPELFAQRRGRHRHHRSRSRRRPTHHHRRRSKRRHVLGRHGRHWRYRRHPHFGFGPRHFLGTYYAPGYWRGYYWRRHYISPLWWSLYLRQPYEHRVVYVTTPAVTEDAQKVVSQLIKAKFELKQTRQGISDLRQRKQDAETAAILEKMQRMDNAFDETYQILHKRALHLKDEGRPVVNLAQDELARWQKEFDRHLENFRRLEQQAGKQPDDRTRDELQRMATKVEKAREKVETSRQVIKALQ